MFSGPTNPAGQPAGVCVLDFRGNRTFYVSAMENIRKKLGTGPINTNVIVASR